LREDQKREFFLLIDRGSTVRAAAMEVGVSPDVGYRWMRLAGLSARRRTPRLYTAEEKAEFFRLLAEQGNVSAVARQLGFVRVTCYKWAHRAGIFTGPNVDEKRDEFLRLRACGMSRRDAANHVGADKRTAQDWDKGIRQFSGGRVHADGTVVTYSTSEKVAAVKRPRSTYLTAPDVEVERLERQIDARFLSLEERERIHDLHRDGMSMRSIAVELCRSPSTISRELARNSQEHVGYLPYGAHRLAASRRVRPKPRKLALNGPLRSYVEAGLAMRWSPEQVSSRVIKDHPADTSMRVCTETIYAAIYDTGAGGLGRRRGISTRTRRTRRKPHRKPTARRKRFVEPMRPIHDRPQEAESRQVAGHWEGDLIIGSFSRSAIGTVVDRTTRFTHLVHLDGEHTAETVCNGLITTLTDLPDELRGTLTWDQGAEMSEHATFRAATGIDVFFCDAASPWQRGTNENTNGLLREYFPKSSNLSMHTPIELQHVADELNSRPRKCLNWDTPAERQQALLSSTPTSRCND
jgi:transposase, IS30 family